MKDMEEIRSPGAHDAIVEAAVLRQLLALHPIQLTVDELAREIGDATEDFAQTDAIERAVRELAAAGLVHRNGDVVMPSRAALHFDDLFD